MIKEIIIFYVPMPDKKSAQDLACILLEKKLIGCGNIVESNSYFNWEDKLNNQNEILLLAKTVKENLHPVMEFIEANHPYEVPLIGHQVMGVNSKYHDWISKQLIKN